ncbi:MAG: T9SS type A sorting domain-containing protein, partial [Bacteroidia bacterium]|nr:T9SS type A sorting domain-containing protein [Bacteroidia bacterium]
MKSLFLAIALCVTSVVDVFAQQITFLKDNFTGGASNTSNITATIGIRNLSSDSNDIGFTWSFINYQKPNGWDIDVCDPFECRFNVVDGGTFAFELAKGASGVFYAKFHPNSISGSSNLGIVVRSITNSLNADTVLINVNTWATSVNEASSAKNIALYPNPVKNQLGISYQSTNELYMDIYNVLGVKVKSFTYTNTSGLIDISDLQNGV